MSSFQSLHSDIIDICECMNSSPISFYSFSSKIIDCITVSAPHFGVSLRQIIPSRWPRDLTIHNKHLSDHITVSVHRFGVSLGQCELLSKSCSTLWRLELKLESRFGILIWRWIFEDGANFRLMDWIVLPLILYLEHVKYRKHQERLLGVSIWSRVWKVEEGVNLG